MILETLGGSFIGAFLQVLFERVASRQFLDFFTGHDIDLQKLKLALLGVNAVLGDAEEKQVTNPLVKEWLDDLKDAIYDAEDLLDEISTEASRSHMDKDLLQVSFAKSNKVKTIMDRLENIAKQKELFILKEVVAQKSSSTLPTTSLIDESDIFGRVDDKTEIVDFLCSAEVTRDHKIPVVAIVGMPGVGKTTLAQLLFNVERVNESFELKVWVHVSEDFDVLKVTKMIYDSVALSDCCNTPNLNILQLRLQSAQTDCCNTPNLNIPQLRLQSALTDCCNTQNLNILQVRLESALSQKKLLLVLDDVWNENFAAWDLLQRPLKAAAMGSRIIVTTRCCKVASTMRAARTHVLPKLSVEDCWSLFKKYAFGTGNLEASAELKEIGKEIAKQCDGLPLAAKTLGALLYSKARIEEWEDVRVSRLWDLPSDVLPALRLSCDHLPPHLKRCFAYCSLFPKGYKIDKAYLIYLWSAEGLLQRPRNGKRLKDVGEEYFSELLSRSFFNLDQDKSSFILHDLLHDLAQSVAGEFCFKLENDNPQEFTEKVRHFSYLADCHDVIDKFDNLFFDAFRARTFLPLNSPLVGRTNLSHVVFDKIFRKLNCLRVLSLSPYREQITSVPDSIQFLKHLRFLDLSRTRIKRLPESVCLLFNLETLLLTECRRLIELPTNMYKLFNLLHLDISQNKLKEMPQKLGSLKNLQLLTDFVVGDNGSRINELKELSELQGTLSILGLQNVTNARDASKANLKGKKHLCELVFHWKTGNRDARNEVQVLGSLQPNENLKKLTIDGYGGTSFPLWLGNAAFSNMVSLCITHCKNCDFLPPLGLLSSLKNLHISNMEGIKMVGSEFCGNASSNIPFRSLEILKFEDMVNWQNWSSFSVDCEKHLPCIQELHIIKCPKLTGNLPNHLSSSKLFILECGELMF